MGSRVDTPSIPQAAATAGVETTAADSRPPESTRRPRRRRILLIDDEAMIRAALRRSLGRTHDVLDTDDAREALGWIADGMDFDAILCDFMMPAMTGDAFHDALSEVCPPLLSRLAFLTAAHSHHADQFFARTQCPRLDKPFESEQLTELLDRLFP